MPRNASGVFTRTNGSFTGSTVWAQQAASADKTINSARHDTHDQDVGDALTASLDRDGKGAMRSNLDVGGFKITNVAAGTAPSDGVRLDQIITAVVDDTSPQLGGDLDVNGNSIVSASAGNIAITPDTTGRVVIDGLTYPDADGTNGQVMTTNGSGVVSFQDNPAPLISEEFVSAEQTITGDSTATVAHGLSSVPKFVFAHMICKTAEFNWSVNDLMHLPYSQNFGGVALARGMSISYDATNIYLIMADGGTSNVFEGHNKTTYARVTFTNTNWRVIVKAYA